MWDCYEVVRTQHGRYKHLKTTNRGSNTALYSVLYTLLDLQRKNLILAVKLPGILHKTSINCSDTVPESPLDPIVVHSLYMTRRTPDCSHCRVDLRPKPSYLGTSTPLEQRCSVSISYVCLEVKAFHSPWIECWSMEPSTSREPKPRKGWNSNRNRNQWWHLP